MQILTDLLTFAVITIPIILIVVAAAAVAAAAVAAAVAVVAVVASKKLFLMFALSLPLYSRLQFAHKARP